MPITCSYCGARQSGVEQAEQGAAAKCDQCGERLLDETQVADVPSLPPHLPDTEAATVPPDSSATRRAATSQAERFGPYRLLRQLGQGGMGVVWEAEHEENGRRVALKLLSPGVAQSEQTVERFIREGRLAASLSHPRSTFVFGAGQEEDQPYIVMELMPGRTLADVLADQGTLPVNRAVDLILDVIEGLEAAHQLGIVHRDVKPSNCFLDGDGRVKVGDFGLSKSLVEHEATLTRTGAFMGTPLFAAPEQVRGGEVDARTDIYAVGATLFYMIAGQGPFTGDAMAVVAQIVSDKPQSLRELRDDVPKALDQIIARTLEKDPAKRFASLKQLRESLVPFATGGTSIADVGRRLAAYMLDGIFVGIVAGVLILHSALLVTVIRALLGLSNAPNSGGFNMSFPVVFPAIQLGAQIIYFTLVEGIWGRGIGKYLMGVRVVDLQGERPGILKALLRAVVIPGTLGLPLIWPIVALSLFMGAEHESLRNVLANVFSLGNLAIMVSFLATMRARNGYRGVHEFASGTRVVRWDTKGAGRLLEVPRYLPLAISEPTRFGPFETSGDLGYSGGARVLQARDELLHRSVWIQVSADDQPSSWRSASTKSRPTRLYWLQGGEVEGKRWDAYEAIAGAPLTSLAADQVDWTQGRTLLRDLAAEFALAAREGSLPHDVSLEQVWVDHGGRIKLLESPVQVEQPASPPSVAESSPEQRVRQAVAAVRQAARLFSRDQQLTLSVQTFLSELDERPEESGTLTWATEQLEVLCEQRHKLEWDDRLGVLGVSMGSEFSIFILATLILSLFAWWIPNLPIAARVALPVLALWMLVAVVGFVTRGGPVFWLLGIRVIRNRDSKPAGRLRCAWRNLVSWGIFVFFYSSSTSLLAVGVLESLGLRNPGQDGFGDMMQNPAQMGFIVGPICMSECLMVFFVIGVVYAILRPSRGLQDHLAGTSLIPSK